MEIAMIVFGMILLNVFLAKVNEKLFDIEYDNYFQVFLFWLFSSPLFLNGIVVLGGKLFGKFLRSLDKFASK